MSHYRTFLCLCLFALIPTAVFAGGGLTFAAEKQAVTAKADATKATISYDFENTSDKTVSIAKWDSACSCLGARIKEGKMDYKPGEKGNIEVDFAIGSFSGTQKKTVMLWTKDDPASSPSSILTVELTIPVLFDISPKSLAWEQNGSKESKMIKIKVLDKNPINITKHNGTNPNFSYNIKTIREGWEYEIEVTPNDVKNPTLGMIKINTDSSIKRYQRQQAFIYVKAPK